MIPFQGYAPDLPPETPGVFTDCQNIVPTTSGFAGAPTFVGIGDSLPATAIGFAVCRKPDNTKRIFSGTSAALYEYTAGAWDDISQALGYSAGADNRWTFVQFGNVTLAATRGAIIQASTTGDFADVAASAPKAKVIESVNNFVFAFNTNETTYGDDPLRWWCSALGDETDWTPSIATQCVTGTFIDTPGPIVGAKKLGNTIVAYKNHAMYLGVYVGAPQVWSWEKIPGEVGAVSNEAVVSTSNAHFFIGTDDFYMFDGSRVVSLQSPVRQWFYSNIDPQFSYRCLGTFDRMNARVMWWFPSKSGGGKLDKCLVYHVTTNKWGRMDTEVECVAEYVEPGIIYNDLGSVYTKYDDLPTFMSYDSPYWIKDSAVVAAFSPAHETMTLIGSSSNSSITTGVYGDGLNYSTITRVRPRMKLTPDTSLLQYSYSNVNYDNMTQNITTQYLNGFYDLLWSARWHKFRLEFTGDHEIIGFDLLLSQDGSE